MKKLAKLVQVTSSRGQVPFSFPEFFPQKLCGIEITTYKVRKLKEHSVELFDMISDPNSILYFK